MMTGEVSFNNGLDSQVGTMSVADEFHTTVVGKRPSRAEPLAQAWYPGSSTVVFAHYRSVRNGLMKRSGLALEFSRTAVCWNFSWGHGDPAGERCFCRRPPLVACHTAVVDEHLLNAQNGEAAGADLKKRLEGADLREVNLEGRTFERRTSSREPVGRTSRRSFEAHLNTPVWARRTSRRTSRGRTPKGPTSLGRTSENKRLGEKPQTGESCERTSEGGPP